MNITRKYHTFSFQWYFQLKANLSVRVVADDLALPIEKSEKARFLTVFDSFKIFLNDNILFNFMQFILDKACIKRNSFFQKTMVNIPESTKYNTRNNLDKN